MSNDIKVGVVGLGYVGLPLAVAFDKKYEVVGFDLNEEKVNKYKNGIDVTNEVGNEKIKSSNINFTTNPIFLRECNRIIVAVPTPINDKKLPDLDPVKSASMIVGKNISKNTIVIFESTVYPGLTEEICMPIIEKYSNLKCGKDFKVGYSPERINPGDKQHKVTNIVKVVSGMDEESLKEIADLYESVLDNGVFKASSIKVAEAAKIIENCQRDINIAFMNEIALICEKLNIKTKDVLEAASTKWNFLKFSPGLVGGHCIGVDPYYLIEKAEELGYSPNLLKSSRNVNENIPKHIVNKIFEFIENKGIENPKIAIFGITFKEDVNDIRNSKSIEIINEIEKKGKEMYIHDFFVNPDKIESLYNIKVHNEFPEEKFDVIVFSVAHTKYKNISIQQLSNMFGKNKILIDIKNMYNEEDCKKYGIEYWSL